jgi:hypothetical protein
LTSQIDSLEQQKRVFEEKRDELETSCDQWEELQKKLADGELVYRPSDISKKRKRETSPPLRNTRNSIGSLYGLNNTGAGLDYVSNREDVQATQVSETPLTKEDIDNELVSIKAKKKEARNPKNSLGQKISESK